ncbi:methyl-accepting chemotaxis protein [Stutzerimonas stutzeri]|uniref:methyl-accepting chemotaxis protein n=1 Tax=Stutzerimonas stutzeri TaxID=316 RepID=UPI0015E3784B|nr:methyl-accepting chemotaxis protein [Stutzerimonas stutzeri]MBA1279028.1 methyl-accepting chemotaxis protein [Stutzerimonas stutzeri]
MSLSLRKKIVLSTCAAVLLAGASQLSLNFIESRKSLESHIAEQVAIASKTFGASVRYWLQSKEAALQSVPVDETSGLHGALVQAKVAGGFENVFFARADGSQINANQVSLPADNNDPRRWKWYQQALLTPSKVYISTPSVAAATGQFVLSLGRTLQLNGQALGVLGADVGMGEILDQLKQIELPGDGLAFFIDKQGTVLGHPDSAYLDKKVTALYPALDQATLAGLVAHRGMRHLLDGDGKRLYAAPIGHADQVLVMVLDDAVLAAPLYSQLWTGLAAFGVILIISLTAIGLLCTWLLRPLGVVSAGLQVIADGNGDLTQRIPEASNDELGSLARHFNQFVGSLHTLVGHIRRHAEDIGGESGDVLQRSSLSVAELGRLQQELALVATAVTEMASATQEIAGNAERTAQSAQQSTHNSQQGLELVRNTQRSITGLADEVAQATGVIAELSQHSQSISGVLASIQGIAEQTNLLALNAAIEAARAGEQGRGFAVVADEVRVLSQRTHASTQEIQATIATFQRITQSAVDKMDSSRALAERSVNDAQQASTALEEITQAAQQISDMSMQIAAAAEEQSAVTEEITRNVVTIKSLGDTLATNSVEGERQAHLLQGHASELNDKVGRFIL